MSRKLIRSCFVTTLVVVSAGALAPLAAAAIEATQRRTTCEAVDPAWSPEGDWIVFASNCEAEHGELYRVRWDGSGLARLTRTPGAEHTPRWSPDGRRIAYAYRADGGAWELRVLDVAAGATRTLIADGHRRLGPTWSPNGQQLAFESERGGNADIFALDVASGVERRLTTSGAREVAPAWSPDGSMIALQSNGGGRYAIEVLDPATEAAPRPLVRLDGQAVTPAWSQDGARLVFACMEEGETDTEICTARADGSRIARLTRNERRDFAPAIAPGGGRIVFMAERPEGGWELRVLSLGDLSETVLPLPGTAGRATATPPERSSEPAWSPDGRRVAFRGGDHSDTDIWSRTRTERTPGGSRATRRRTRIPRGHRTVAARTCPTTPSGTPIRRCRPTAHASCSRPLARAAWRDR